LGASVAGTVVRREQPGGFRALLIGAWVLGIVGLVAMMFAERSAVGVGLGTLLSSEAGQPFLDRGVAMLITGGVVAFAVVRRNWTSLPAVAVAAAAAMLVHALSGHANASDPAWFNVGAQWLHMLGAGVWVGGLTWLVLSLRSTPGEERPRLVTRFSRQATIGLAVVAVTGLFRALDEIGPFADWGRLFTTSYGWALVVKVAIATVLVALGARNRYRNVPAVASGASPQGILRRTVMAEVMVAAGVFAATGVLSELPPAATVKGNLGPPVVQPVVVSGSDFATSVRVRLTVTPGTVGPNRFDARVTDYDTGKPVDASSVRLEFSLPGSPDVAETRLELKEGRPGQWSATGTELSMFGRWAVDVVIQEPSGGVEVHLRVQPRLPDQQVTKQVIPRQPTVYSIALPGTGELQTYIDPGKPGTNGVHFTFFDTSGNELPIADATASALTPGGVTEPLELDRFSKGHFVANTRLGPGSWLFLIDATTRSGQRLSGYFEQRIQR
jgi:putative copper export protein/nitrogen fixation protein FixH